MPVLGELKLRQRINMVTLLVTERCNLQCRYCYQAEGLMRRNAVNMTEADARAIAQKLMLRFEGIQQIQFFGGEPSLNLPAVRAFSDELRCLTAMPVSPRMPQLGMITNGAGVRTDDLVRCCVDNAIGSTVSIDGPKEIHDLLRPTIGKKGSFDRAMGTLLRLKEAGVPVAVETVVTAVHLDHGYSVASLLKFFSSLGIRKVILHTAYPPAPATISPFGDRHFGRLVASFEDAVDWWFDTLLRGDITSLDVYFADLLRPILNGKTLTVKGTGCPAGSADIAIGPSGDVYACHLVYGNPAHQIGNIFDDAPLEVQGTNLPFDTADFPDCQQCFARSWCQPCGALNLAWGNAWALPQRECELRRAVLERLARLSIEHLEVPRNGITDALWSWATPSGDRHHRSDSGRDLQH